MPETTKSLKSFIDKLPFGTKYSLTAKVTQATIETNEMPEEEFNYLIGHPSCVKVKFSSKEDGTVYGVVLNFKMKDDVVLEEGVV